jgi:Bacterial PH domain
VSLAPGHSRLLRRHFLGSDERVILETHPSKWWYFWWPAIAAVFVAFFDYVVATRVYSGLPPSNWMATLPDPGLIPWTNLLLTFSIMFTVGWVFWFGREFYLWVAQTYVVTDDRVVEQTGIIRHVIQEIPIRQIRDIDVFQNSLKARVCRYGNLRFKSLSEIESPEHTVEFYRLASTYDPEDPEAKKTGVEWWVGVPNPFRIERVVEDETRSLSGQNSPSTHWP